MHVQNLSDKSFEITLDCFLQAFENYFVKMPCDKDYYKRRWKAAKVDFNSSYGMFDDKKMVGFIIHAIDYRNGSLTAFNTGTGVIPEYRGRGIIKTIYEHAFKDLSIKRIEKSVLEVITKNDIAISLYSGIGFNIVKEYKCYKGKIKMDSSHQHEIREIDLKLVNWNSLPHQQLYSWDNQHESIVVGDYKFFYVFHDEKPESFFVINTEQNYLAQFDTLIEKKDVWKRLLTGIKQVCASIRINNVDVTLEEKHDNLISYGLENTIDQYEMEMRIG